MEKEEMLKVILSGIGLYLLVVIWLVIDIIMKEKKILRALQRFNDFHNLKEGDEGYINPKETLKEFKTRL